MKVFIANFGQGNALWPECFSSRTIATVDHEQVHRFWVAGDREGYIEFTLANLKTVRGETPIRPVASRWYGLLDVMSETAGDIWIHREKEELWWTTSGSDPIQTDLIPALDPKRDGSRLYRISKPCEPWSNRTRTGAKLTWSGLHPKAKDFLFTEGTLQQLQPDNAAYALTLLDGGDLSSWHARPNWKAKESKAKHGSATVFNAQQKSAWIMVDTVKKTVAASNGQQVLRTLKNKECAFTEEELLAYLMDLLREQDFSCALTGLPLQFHGEQEDDAMLCSLDRIDSDGHYAPGNLQIVCRFVNRWKSDTSDEEFRRLLRLVRAQQLAA